MRPYLLASIVWLLCALTAAAQEPSSVAIVPSDVRMVIDISGSMKKTDPQNLRKPAMELLIKLLPDKSRAGVWSFGQSVNLLVPHKEVDKTWRDEATGKTIGINSVALFTHIGAALEQAAYDMENPDKTFRNNIILLTDGVVDIETSAEVNARERERILNELLPRLQQAGYVIHTIALSDDADKVLMEKLSLATDGVFATVKDADGLMSAFLRIFDQAVPMERLPLEKNRFLVDASVEEFTALIFRKPGAQPTALLAPDGNQYTAANALGTVKWHKTASYDLITVIKPVTGEWQVSAELDPDSRVTVVSNLTLVMNPLKNNIEVSQPLDLRFSLQEDGAQVVDPQFLQLLELDVSVTRNRDGRIWQIPLVNTVPPIDGIYFHPLELFRETGNYSVQLLIDGKTFKREFKHQVTVGSPFVVSMERILHENRVTYRLLVSADDQRVDVSKTTVVAQLRDSVGGSAIHNFELDEQGRWQLLISPQVAARYSIGLQVSGLRKDGEPVKETLATQYFAYPDKDDPVPATDVEPIAIPAEPEPAPEEVDAPVEEALEEASASPVSLEKPAKSPVGIKWMMIISVGLVNLLVFGLAYLAFRMIVGKKAKEEIAELEETLNLDVKKIVDNKKPIPAMQELVETSKAIDVSEENPSAEIDINTMTKSGDDFDDFLSEEDFSLDKNDRDQDDPDKN